jgi:hypothetical protein
VGLKGECIAQPGGTQTITQINNRMTPTICLCAHEMLGVELTLGDQDAFFSFSVQEAKRT